MNCGIDFGTRNTAIVKGERRVTGVSGNTIPSFVAYSRMGLPRRIGETARWRPTGTWSAPLRCAWWMGSAGCAPR
jgi:molecular chaperone DnaK (HSP70)